MNRKAWALAWLSGFGLVVGLERAGRAQGLLPQAPGVNLPQVSRRMAEALRDLVEDVSAAAFQSPSGQFLARDCKELQRAAGEWFDTTRGTNDPYQLRRSYSGIDVAWHRLRDQLAAPGVANQAIADEIRRVDQADATIHQALNLNAYPPNLEGQAGAPTGLDETRRLAYGMAQRGEALASMVQGIYGPIPGTAPLINDAAEVARLADAFSDSLNNPNAIPSLDRALQAFVPLFQKSAGLGVNLDRYQMPPNVRSAWLAYATALNMTRDNLKATSASVNPLPSPNAPVGFPYNSNPAPQVTRWAEELDRQVDELIANFAPTAPVVPEGRDMLGEMMRLRDDVRNFRGDAARGLDPARLAFEFREVDADWQRLARRVNRIAKGRTGPNIQRVQQIGQTCEQIHQVLAMPGYPPVIQPY